MQQAFRAYRHKRAKMFRSSALLNNLMSKYTLYILIYGIHVYFIQWPARISVSR